MDIRQLNEELGNVLNENGYTLTLTRAEELLKNLIAYISVINNDVCYTSKEKVEFWHDCPEIGFTIEEMKYFGLLTRGSQKYDDYMNKYY